MFNYIRNIYVKYLVWRGKAIDIWSKNEYPAGVLSNLCSNAFEIDGVKCGSMEGFLQSLKHSNIAVQKAMCQMKGRNAKSRSSSTWKADQKIYWLGKEMPRQSEEYMNLLRRAYRAMFDQSERFRSALLQSRGKRLYHTAGVKDPTQTILTEQEFCQLLTELRDNLDPAKYQEAAQPCYRKRCPFRKFSSKK